MMKKRTLFKTCGLFVLTVLLTVCLCGLFACGEKETFEYTATPPTTMQINEEIDFADYLTLKQNDTVKLYVSYTDDDGNSADEEEQTGLSYTLDKYTTYTFKLVKVLGGDNDLTLTSTVTVPLPAPAFSAASKVETDTATAFTLSELLAEAGSALTPADYNNEVSLVSVRYRLKAYVLSGDAPDLAWQSVTVSEGTSSLTFDVANAEYEVVIKAENRTGNDSVTVKVLNYEETVATVQAEFKYVFNDNKITIEEFTNATAFVVWVEDADPVNVTTAAREYEFEADVKGDTAVKVAPVYEGTVWVDSINEKNIFVGNRLSLTNERELNAMDIWDTDTTDNVKAAQGIESISFNHYSWDTFFMVEFTGKNVPNFAVGAQKVITEIVESSTTDVQWTVAGVLLANSYTKNRQGGLYVSRGFSDKTGLVSIPYSVAGEAGKGPGYGYFNDDMRYLMIVGYEALTIGTTPYNAQVSVKILTVNEDGELTLVKSESAQFNTLTHVSNGTKAVIYPNVILPAVSGCLTQIHFGYEAPADSLNKLVNGLDDEHAYKASLKEILEIGDPEEDGTNTFETKLSNQKTLAAMDINDFDNPGTSLAGNLKPCTGIESVVFDRGNATADSWLILDFVGKNVPNFSFGAQEVIENMEITPGANEFVKAGAVVANSYPGTTGAGIYGFRGFHSSPAASTNYNSFYITGEAGKGPGLNNFTDGVRYIFIIGFQREGTTNNGRITVKVFTVNDTDGTLTLVTDKNALGGTFNTCAGSKTIIYPSVAGLTLDVPSSVTFGYEAPQGTLSELINSLASTCEYKTQLATLLDVTLS